MSRAQPARRVIHRRGGFSSAIFAFGPGKSPDLETGDEGGGPKGQKVEWTFGLRSGGLRTVDRTPFASLRHCPNTPRVSARGHHAPLRNKLHYHDQQPTTRGLGQSLAGRAHRWRGPRRFLHHAARHRSSPARAIASRMPPSSNPRRCLAMIAFPALAIQGPLRRDFRSRFPERRITKFRTLRQTGASQYQPFEQRISGRRKYRAGCSPRKGPRFWHSRLHFLRTDQQPGLGSMSCLPPGLKNELSEPDNFWESRQIGSPTPGVTFLFHSRIQFPRSSHSPRAHGS